MSHDLEILENISDEIDSIDDVVDIVVSALDGNTPNETILALKDILPRLDASGFEFFRKSESSESMILGSKEVVYIEESANPENRVFITLLITVPFQVLDVSRTEPEIINEKSTQ